MYFKYHDENKEPNNSSSQVQFQTPIQFNSGFTKLAMELPYS